MLGGGRGEDREGKLATYREIQRILIPWSNNSQSGTVHSCKEDMEGEERQGLLQKSEEEEGWRNSPNQRVGGLFLR